MTPTEEQKEFYALLGHCITQWSHVEDALYENFTTAASPRSQIRSYNYALQAAFFALQAPEPKISITSSAVTFSLLTGMSEDRDDPQRILLTVWQGLAKRIGNKKMRRNQLAHFQVMTFVGPSAKPGRRFQLRPPLFNLNMTLRTPRSFYCAELEAIRRSFGRLSFDLSTFAEELGFLLKQREGDRIREDRLQQLIHQIGDRRYEGTGLPDPASTG